LPAPGLRRGRNRRQAAPEVQRKLAFAGSGGPRLQQRGGGFQGQQRDGGAWHGGQAGGSGAGMVTPPAAQPGQTGRAFPPDPVKNGRGNPITDKARASPALPDGEVRPCVTADGELRQESTEDDAGPDPNARP